MRPIFDFPELIAAYYLIPLGIVFSLIGIMIAPLVYIFELGFKFNLYLPSSFFVFGLIQISIGVWMKRLYLKKIYKYIYFLNTNGFHVKGFELSVEKIKNGKKKISILKLEKYDNTDDAITKI